MLKFVTLFLVATALLFAIKPKPPKPGSPLNRYISLEDTLHLPFDTASVLALYDLHLSDFSRNAPADLDTFVLHNRMYACDCPSWATEEEAKQTEDYNSMNPDENVSHDVFYIERGDKKMTFPDEFSGMGNRIRFFGKIRTRQGLPNEGLMDPNPALGPVLTVYGYEVILPAAIYGPFVYVPDPTGKMSEWAQNEMTTLVVTKDNYFPPKTKSR